VHGDNRGILAEAIVSWVALIGVAMALQVYWAQRSRNALEQRLLFLLELIALLLLVRGAFWLTHAPVLGVLTYLPAAVLPLAMVLYVEGLLRRHLPLPAKVTALAGSALFTGLALAGRLHADPFWLPIYSIFVVGTQLLLTAVLLFRDHGDLGAVESRAVHIVTIAVVLMVPFVLTDVATDLGMNMVRVGSVGILLFVYATVAASGSTLPRTVLAETFAVLAVSWAVGAGHAWLIHDPRAATVGRSFSFFACLLFVVILHARIRAQRMIARESGLIRAVGRADVRDLDGFLRVLESIAGLAAFRLLREPDLGRYDVAQLPAFFAPPASRVASLSRLRRDLRRGTVTNHFHAEQVVDLLEEAAMTHAVMISARPLVLLVVRVPSPGNDASTIAQLELVGNVAGSIEERRRAGSAA